MIKRRFLFTIILTFLLLISFLIFSSCSRTISNGLMEGATPETSALEFFQFDGNTVFSAFLFDEFLIEQLLEELDTVTATRSPDWTLDDITLPIYGFWIGDVTGQGIAVAWSNGYWITQEGYAYSFDFDFEILQSYPWEHERDFSSFTAFPNARILTKNENGWNQTLLTPVNIENFDTPMTDITMTLVDWNSEQVTVTIANESNDEWMYGEHFSLHVFLDNEWFDVPPLPNFAFSDIGLIVPASGEVSHVYALDMFGNLPRGFYRLVAYGLYVEFEF